jgi:eukaryotic-like serine/threonine-protein kinase
MATTWLSDRVIDHLAGLGEVPRLAEWRYEYREEIGRGGMGVVYRAFDRELARDVAVKVLHAPARPGMAERLLREARIIARLEHPGIVPIYDVGQTQDGVVAYVMQLVRGERLDARIVRGLREAEAFRIFDRICEAVASAHSRGVIHRDLKPENIMLGSFGEVLVLDWGIARAGDPEAEGTVMGTPGAMAPEQAAGRGIDARADVYGLGGILSALCGGRDVPRPLAAIAARAQAADAGARYPTAAGLAADVTAFANGQPVSAYRENLLERAQRLARRNRSALLLVMVYLLLRMLLFIAGGL